MITTYKPEYLVNEKGIKTKVLLNYEDYIKLLEMIEDLQDSKLIEETKDEPEISFEEYKRKRTIV